MKKLDRNYDGNPITPEQVVVPFMYDSFFAENCVNPDCIGKRTIAGHSFKVIYVAINKEWAKDATSQFHLLVNEELGHYSRVPAALKKELEKKDRPQNPFVKRAENEFESAPAADADLLAQEEMESEKEQILKTFEAFLDKAPKHAYAAILMALGIKGKEFADSLRLGHDAANTVRKQVESIAPDSVDSINQLNFEQLKVRTSKNDRYYIEQAGKALDLLIDMYW